MATYVTIRARPGARIFTGTALLSDGMEGVVDADLFGGVGELEAIAEIVSRDSKVSRARRPRPPAPAVASTQEAQVRFYGESADSEAGDSGEEGVEADPFS